LPGPIAASIVQKSQSWLKSYSILGTFETSPFSRNKGVSMDGLSQALGVASGPLNSDLLSGGRAHGIIACEKESSTTLLEIPRRASQTIEPSESILPA
jgi:hypothetical protein